MTAPKIVLLPDPYTMDWRGWAEVVAGYNPALVGAVDPDEPWDRFADRFCQVLPEAPTPDKFSDWRDWASSLKLVFAV